jgi:uncharacterized protein YkwD
MKKNKVKRLQETGIRLLKNVTLALLLLFLVGLAGVITASAQQPPDPAQVDLLALEREILTEINKLRTNPAGMAATLVDMKNNATVQRGDPVLTFPSGQRWVSDYTYLNSAISDAQRQTPLQPLSWAEGLYQAAHNYAIRLPKGHRDFGTTPASRVAPYGSAAGGVGEGIMYGGNSAFEHVAGLYIDAGVPNLGHRKQLVDPSYTHVGVGCGYDSRARSITCVVKYGANWTEKSDEVNPEFNKQFAFKNKAGQFQYAILKPSSDRKWAYQVHPCPGNVGWISVPDAADLTTVEQAQADGRTAINQPCDTATAPFGVLNNGTSLAQAPTNVTGLPDATAPTPASTATQAPTEATPQPTATTAPTRTPAPTLTPQPTSTPPPTATPLPTATPDTSGGSTAGSTLQLSSQTQYAYQTGPNTFQYVLHYRTRFTPGDPNTINYFDICPTVFDSSKITSANDLALEGPNAYWSRTPRSVLAGSELEAVYEVDDAWAVGLRPTNEPCFRTPYDTRNPSQAGHVYALVNPNGSAFQHVHLTAVNRGSIYTLWSCPIDSTRQRITLYYADISRLIPVSEATAQGLPATNAICQDARRPWTYPLGN